MPGNAATAVGLASSEAPRRRRKPGPKPGQRHPGQFTSDDPRRWMHGPRPKAVVQDFQNAVRELVPDALQALSDILNDPNTSHKELREAASLIISHAHGSPVNRVAVAQMNGNGASRVDSMDLPALRKRASFLLEKINSDDADDNVIDGECEPG